MKNSKRFLSGVLALLVFMSVSSISLFAYAEGTGSEDNPFRISTAQELQDINNNLTASYILTANIDLSGVDFEPIGNAEAGTFQGTFDGNGYTISNLNVFSGKYAGLFGCNEGIIKNVILKNIYVYGTRYIGGVVGENTPYGTVVDCKVLNGEIESNGGINVVYAGGVCGFNEGDFVGRFSNGADLKIANTDYYAVAGGIIGWNNKETELTASNTGNISSSSSSSRYSYFGGIVGRTSSISLNGCLNYGSIFDSSKYANACFFAAGIVCEVIGTVLLENCKNYGDNYNYGILGFGDESVIINSCENYGNDVDCGILGNPKGDCKVTHCYNYGLFRGAGIIGNRSNSQHAEVIIQYCGNYGNCVNGGSCVGGIMGSCSGITDLLISGSFNAGNIAGTGRGDYDGIGGIIGRWAASGKCIIDSCYNSGSISTFDKKPNGYGERYHCGGVLGNDSKKIEVTNCYNTGNINGESVTPITTISKNTYNTGNIFSYRIEGSTGDYFCSYIKLKDDYYFNIGKYLSEIKMNESQNFESFDFNEIWKIDPNYNSGYPSLILDMNPLKINCCNKTMIKGEQLQLTAYENNEMCNVKWSVSSDAAIVNENGLVTATNSGLATITATDNRGRKVNCNIYVMPKNTSAVLNDFDINKGKTSTQTVIMGVSGDYLTNVTSNDSNVLNIDSFGNKSITLSAKSPGTVTISFKTAQGFTGSCLATVTNYATSISLSSTSKTINRGESTVLTATTSPTGNDNIVTWTSSNESVATVDQNGLVTAVGIGTATIMAQTDNGLGATCTVTVKAPATSINYVNNNIKVAIGETYQLSTVVSPADTTDTITFNSNSTSIATVSSAGVVTAKAVGTTYITATTTSGKSANCFVTVVSEATDLTLSQDSCKLRAGEEFVLNATVTPADATDKTIIWNTNNEEIATVSQDGVVTAVSPGKAIITATSSSGITKICEVTVLGVLNTTQPRIYIPTVSDRNSEYISVPVLIENNPGISFASISVGYDANELEPIDVTNGTVFDSVTGSFDTDNNVVKLYFTSEENKTADGNLAIIRFRVINTGAVETRVSVAYMPGGITNNAEEAVAFNLADGRVETELCIHENTEVRNAKTATCTEQGYTGDIYCLDCGDLLETGTVLDITPHHYQTTVFEPTENKQGYTKYVCTDCGYSYVGDITDYVSDNSVLIAILETIASYSKEDYSADSFANLQAIYNKYSSMATGSYAQIEIDNATFDLITAVSALEPYLNLNISAPNGAFTVTYNGETNSNNGNSLLFGTNVTLTATANEGYEFVGWYDTINNLYFSKNAEYSFKLTTNTSLKAVFVNEQSATLTFTTYSNWVQSTITKTIDEWNAVTSIDELLPAVPYRYGYTNGRWVYDNAEVLEKLQTGENVSLIPEYDKDDTSLPTPPSPKGDTPVLDLYYKLDADANVGSFVMAVGIPENCQLESVGILFYYKNADEFDPTKFELLINNKMLAGRFNTDEADDIYIINMNKMSAYKNWVARGYVTYYDAEGNLKTVYSNQINIVNREQV